MCLCLLTSKSPDAFRTMVTTWVLPLRMSVYTGNQLPLIVLWTCYSDDMCNTHSGKPCAA